MTYILLKIKVIFEIKSVFNLIIVILDFIRYICIYAREYYFRLKIVYSIYVNTIY